MQWWSKVFVIGYKILLVVLPLINRQTTHVNLVHMIWWGKDVPSLTFVKEINLRWTKKKNKSKCIP